MEPNSHLSVLLAVALTVSLAGCGILSPGTDSPLDSDSLVENVQQTERYNVTVKHRLRSSGANDTRTVRGVVDREDREVRLQQTLRTAAGRDVRTTETELYFVDGTEYVNSSGGWEQYDHGPEGWQEFDYLDGVAETLERGEFERIGTQEIDGRNTTVYRVHVSSDRADELMGANQSEHVPRTIEEFAYFVNVDVETNELYRTDRRAVVRHGGERAIIRVEATFREPDEPVDVTLPAEVTTVSG